MAYTARHTRTRRRPGWRLVLFTLSTGLLAGAGTSAALLAANPGGLIR